MEQVTTFWSTLPGFLTAFAALLVALTGLFAALHKAGLIGRRATDDDTAQSRDTLAAANGIWEATVAYDWGASHRETFRLTIDSGSVLGSASFLGVMRAVEDGRVENTQLQFVTHSRSEQGSESRDAAHHYQATLSDGQLHFIMQTTGGFQNHVPINFTARRMV